MATACPSLNFSFKCPSCLSALSGLVGGCFNFGGGKKLNKDESEFLIDSSSVDLVSAADADDPDNNSPQLPTLLVPGSFFSSTPNLEDNNSGSILINSVMVEYLQSVNLTKESDKADTSQSLTTYNAPVRINSKENDCGHIEIQSIPVQKTDEKMDNLAKSHMDNFSELMLSGEANVSDCEAKLPTPMRQVDELDSNGDSKYEAMDSIFTKIDGNNFPEDGVVLTMPTPIREEVLDKNSGDLPMHSPFPRVLQVNPVQQVFTPTYLPAGVSNENSDGSLSPIQPNFGMHNDPWGAEFEPPKEETYKDRIYSAFQGVDNNLHPQENNEGGERSCYRRTPSDHIDLHPFSRVAEKKVVVVDIHPTHPQFMTDEEYKKWEEEQGQKTRIKSPPSNSFDEFFAEILISKNSKDFFRTLNEYVSSFTSGIEGIFPSPAPASPRAEPNNGNGKGKQ